MQVTDLLSPERIRLDAHAGSKKKLLEIISTLLTDGEDSDETRMVFESLCARERLGSTAMGHGVAIPHGRLTNATSARAAFVKLHKPIQFEANNSDPVDMLFALAVPQDCTKDHLQLISQIAEMFEDETLRQQLRNADSSKHLQSLLANWKH